MMTSPGGSERFPCQREHGGEPPPQERKQKRVCHLVSLKLRAEGRAGLFLGRHGNVAGPAPILQTQELEGERDSWVVVPRHEDGAAEALHEVHERSVLPAFSKKETGGQSSPLAREWGNSSFYHTVPWVMMNRFRVHHQSQFRPSE